MARSANPQASIIAQVSAALAPAAASSGNPIPGIQADLGKLQVGETVSRVANGGGYGNFTGTSQSALGGAGNAVQTAVAGAGAGLRNLGNVAGSISNIASDIGRSIDKIASGGLASGIAGIASKISGAAGQLNNLLSGIRGANLPAGGELFSSGAGEVTELKEINSEDWRVRIDCNWDLFKSDLFNQTLKPTGGMVWPFIPNITLSSKANYTQQDPVHSNYSFQAYKNSQIDDIQIAGEFSCETTRDALYWIAATRFLRSSTKMFFGTGENVGNPPIICRLHGYGANIFNGVPVVIKSFQVDLKDDVQYIKCEANGLATTWVPVMSTISVTVAPIYNRTRLRDFSLEDFAQGATTRNYGFH
jgi:hypothetical protein